MKERLPFVQLARSKAWVPKNQAKAEASAVYEEFSGNPLCSDDLLHLAFVAEHDDPTIEARFMKDALQERLVNRGYLEKTLGSLASRATLKAQVAANMIEADLDEGLISGHIVEPFVGKEILPELYMQYQKLSMSS